jgi:signal transduction histidine kinase
MKNNKLNLNNLNKLENKEVETGMIKNIQNKIFTNEMTDSTPGTNGEKGTGLGLHIFKEKKGSIYYFTLPANISKKQEFY